jgi:UDP-N-acetylglucosamine--N-acetylmuramyl-(pentapeptide) pyrophosphoryl-undecaprenol N-acetylglucosamine transferase
VKVVIAGGGTAGHVFPAIALAQELVRGGDAQVRFLGTPGGLEARLVPEAGFAFTPIDAAPLTRTISWATVRAPLAALRSVGTCRPLVRDADVVVGMGGYVSVPPVLAARRSHRPVVLHEQNAVPGLANRVLARGARTVALSFADADARLPRAARTVVTGDPVRERILEVPANREALRKEACAELDLEEGRRTVLIFGGSLGARHVDETVGAALRHLRDRDDLQLLVLTGPAHLELVAGPARVPMSLRVRTLPFLDRMELGYAVADLAVARAGATSVAELAVCGVPSMLIPYPHATANHQEANARALERAGAAEMLLDSALEPADLARRIGNLVGDVERRAAMSVAASAWARPDAAVRLAAVVREAAAVGEAAG